MKRLLPFFLIALASQLSIGQAPAPPKAYITPSPGEADQAVNQTGGSTLGVTNLNKPPSYNSIAASPAVTPSSFGAYGDAFSPPNGCTTTASSTTVVCPDSPFVSTDVGKQMWVSGVGAGWSGFQRYDHCLYQQHHGYGKRSSDRSRDQWPCCIRP